MVKKVIFVQPFLVNEKTAVQCEGMVAVLDVAFNGGNPRGKGTLQEQFEATTVAFITALGGDLAVWVDHHPHMAWAEFASDSRFILIPREQAPACPPLITEELIETVGEVETIVAHGDFDGVMSAVMFALGGMEPYEGAIADAIAADTRKGQLSQTGQRLEEAMKADLRDDSIREAVFNELVHGDVDARTKVNGAQQRYQAIQAETNRVAGLFQVTEKVAFVDATEAETLDMTQLLLAGQKITGVAIVRAVSPHDGKVQLTIAGPQGWDFVSLFGLGGGMPNRITIPDQEDVETVIAKINGAVETFVIS